MKKITIMVFVCIVLLIDSCITKRYNVSYTISNYSDHKIELLVLKSNQEYDTILLPFKGSDTVMKPYSEDVVIDPPPFLSSSVKVTYDDSITITHYRTVKQDASRSILLEQYWTGGNTGNQNYKWVYLFTNSDYEEAVSLQ